MHTQDIEKLIEDQKLVLKEARKHVKIAKDDLAALETLLNMHKNGTLP